jgi:hypothetical protein
MWMVFEFRCILVLIHANYLGLQLGSVLGRVLSRGWLWEGMALTVTELVTVTTMVD